MAGWQGMGTSPDRACPGAGLCRQSRRDRAGREQFPVEVTAQMVANFREWRRGDQPVLPSGGAELRVVALDLDRPTADFTRGMALDVPDLVARSRPAGRGGSQADVIPLGKWASAIRPSRRRWRRRPSAARQPIGSALAPAPTRRPWPTSCAPSRGFETPLRGAATAA